jgi:hypothetical protein
MPMIIKLKPITILGDFMKKFLAIAILASSSDIYDIMYLPNAGTTYGFSTINSLDAELESDQVDAEASGYRFQQSIGHAFSDRLLVQLDLDYLDAEVDPEAGTSTDLKGLSDPTFGARFRMMDEKFRWDLTGGAFVSIQDHEIDSSGDADNLQGGHSLFLGTQLGAKTENMQWAVLAKLTHNLKAETKVDSAIGADSEDDANNELLLRGDLLNKLAKKSFIRSHLSAEFAEGFDDDSNEESYAPSTSYEMGAEYQHLCSQNLLVRLGVAYLTIDQKSAQIDRNIGWTYNFGVNYQF